MPEDSTVFDAEYVSKLRNEAGKYRTKVKDLESELSQYRDLEGQILQVRVENELVRRGINADPSWVKVGSPDEIPTAIDSFVEKYPQFMPAQSQEEEPPRRREMPGSMPPEPNKANNPGPPPIGSFGGRTTEEIKGDPIARKKLIDQYRGLLGQNTD